MGFWSNFFSNNNNSYDSGNNDEDNLNDDENTDEDNYEYYCNEFGCGIATDDDYTEYDGNIFCTSCANNLELTTCDECGNTFPSYRIQYDEYSGNNYCDDCRERDIPNYDSNGNSDFWRED